MRVRHLSLALTSSLFLIATGCAVGDSGGNGSSFSTTGTPSTVTTGTTDSTDTNAEMGSEESGTNSETTDTTATDTDPTTTTGDPTTTTGDPTTTTGDPTTTTGDPTTTTGDPTTTTTTSTSTSTSTSSTTGGGSAYGDPALGCDAGEENVTITGATGGICSPPCVTNFDCPAPPNGSAIAQCVLTLDGATDPTNCALTCQVGTVPDQCPTGATCKDIMATVGVCTYP